MLSLQPNNSRGLVGLGICRLELNETEAGFANLRAAARVDARIFGQVVSALASAGQGRFWLMPSAARRFLKEEGA
jgi:hypothetical protein